MSNVKDAIEAMPAKLRADRAAGAKAVIQCEVGGEGGGIWHGVIKDGTLSVKQGPAASPKVTLKMDSRDWLSLSSGTHSAQTLFRAGKMKIQGDMGLAVKLSLMFRI